MPVAAILHTKTWCVTTHLDSAVKEDLKQKKGMGLGGKVKCVGKGRRREEGEKPLEAHPTE